LLRIRSILTPPLGAGIGYPALFPCSLLTHHAACKSSVCCHRAGFISFRYAAAISSYLRREICT
jgi:hypothetical protein